MENGKGGLSWLALSDRLSMKLIIKRKFSEANYKLASGLVFALTRVLISVREFKIENGKLKRKGACAFKISGSSEAVRKIIGCLRFNFLIFRS